MKKFTMLVAISCFCALSANMASALSMAEIQPTQAATQLAEQPKYNAACNITLKSDVEISPSAITFYRSEQAIYRIDADLQLSINQQKIKLTQHQQKQLNAYEKHLRSLIPKVKHTSNNIVHIALKTANSFSSVLGNNSTTLNNIQHDLSLIKAKINARLDGKKPVYLDQQGKFVSEFYQGNAEQRIQQIVASALAESMTRLLQGVLFSGEKMSSVEAKVEKFKTEINTAMTVKKAEIEQEAKTLCLPIKQLVPLEEKLKTAIPQLANTQVFLVAN